MSNNKTRKLFSEFSAHVRDNVRSSKNPSVGVSDEPTETVNYLLVDLKNVDKGTAKLYATVQEFAPGTKLETIRPAGEGEDIYRAKIPLVTQAETYGGSKRSKRAQPTLTKFLVSVILLLGTVSVAIATTKSSDWSF